MYLAETEFKEKHGVWDPMLELTMTITSPYVHSRVDSNTFTMGIGQPYARVDLNPTPESTLFPSQGFWIWPLISSRAFHYFLSVLYKIFRMC
jgi:hypothetical protein